MVVITSLAYIHPRAEAVVAVDMTQPRRTPRLVPLRRPLAAPAQWPRFGDEMRAGVQPIDSSSYTLWLRGTRRYGEDVGGQGAWSPSGRYLMTRWFHGEGPATTLRIFDRNGRLLATRRNIDRAVYWSYEGDALIMRQASGKRSVWSRDRVPPSVAQGDDRMDRVYRTLMRTIARAENAPMNVAERIPIDSIFNSVVGAATYTRTRIHETDDHRTYSESVLYWWGPGAGWSRPLDEHEGGFVPVAGGWACGAGSLDGRPALFLRKGGSRLFIPAPGDVEDCPPVYVH